MNDYANYYELANAITSLCISDYTKEMCKYYHSDKYKEKEIYECERYLLESVIMKLMYSEDERINILEKLKEDVNREVITVTQESVGIHSNALFNREVIYEVF